MQGGGSVGVYTPTSMAPVEMKATLNATVEAAAGDHGYLCFVPEVEIFLEETIKVYC